MYIKRNLLFAIMLTFLVGCAVNPDDRPIYQFNSDVVRNNPLNSVITSVASEAILRELMLPTDRFAVSGKTLSPERLDGVPTLSFSKKFAGAPIDRNFQVEVLSGIKRLSVRYYANDAEIKECIVEFTAEPGRKYYTKFLIGTSKVDGNERIAVPVIYDLTNNLRVAGRIISDETIGVTSR